MWQGGIILMRKDTIILYAKVIKKSFPDLSIIEIARLLSYKVVLINLDFKFLTANNYRYENNNKVIFINSNFSKEEQNILCAHELGHAILDHPYKNTYKDKNLAYEYEANLFAVSLLFNEDDFNMPFIDMSNYTLQTILDKNISSI